VKSDLFTNVFFLLQIIYKMQKTLSRHLLYFLIYWKLMRTLRTAATNNNLARIYVVFYFL